MNNYDEWLKRARSSLELAKFSDNETIYYEDLCYQAQQAVEKCLKGLLIFYNVEPERTHNLYILLQKLENFTDIDNDIRDVLKLYNYAVQTRYPGNYGAIDKEEYEESIVIAEKCLIWVEKKIKESLN